VEDELGRERREMEEPAPRQGEGEGGWDELDGLYCGERIGRCKSNLRRKRRRGGIWGRSWWIRFRRKLRAVEAEAAATKGKNLFLRGRFGGAVVEGPEGIVECGEPVSGSVDREEYLAADNLSVMDKTRGGLRRRWVGGELLCLFCMDGFVSKASAPFLVQEKERAGGERRNHKLLVCFMTT